MRGQTVWYDNEMAARPGPRSITLDLTSVMLLVSRLLLKCIGRRWIDFDIIRMIVLLQPVAAKQVDHARTNCAPRSKLSRELTRGIVGGLAVS